MVARMWSYVDSIGKLTFIFVASQSREWCATCVGFVHKLGLRYSTRMFYGPDVSHRGSFFFFLAR